MQTKTIKVIEQTAIRIEGDNQYKYVRFLNTETTAEECTLFCRNKNSRKWVNTGMPLAMMDSYSLPRKVTDLGSSLIGANTMSFA